MTDFFVFTSVLSVSNLVQSRIPFMRENLVITTSI